MNILIIILVFGLIITIHELGHFLMCKLNGIAVKEFSIGMGPSIFHVTKKDTLYSIRLLPIGGYCLMLGEDEDNCTDERAFGNKSVWARITVVLAGPAFNFILAFFLAMLLITFAGYDSSEVDYVGENSACEQAGIEVGDSVLRINNSRIYNFREVYVFMQFHQNDDPVRLLMERKGEQYEVTVTPVKSESGTYQIGFAGGYNRKQANLLTNIKYSALEVRYWIKTTFISLKELLTGGASVKDLSGPVGIADMMNDTMEEANNTGGIADVMLNVLNFCILISANLGVMNLLPIPALDGGRLLFLAIEGIRRKRIPAEKEAVVHFVGFVLLLLLMAVVMFNDIKNVFFVK